MDISAGNSTDALIPSPHASFILRCWLGEDAQVRARLINVQSGVGHTVAALDALPQLVARLVQEGLAPLAENVPEGGAP